MSQMPDKIWLHKDTKYNTGDVVCGYQYEFAQEIECEGIENFVEYVPVDSFIEKACGAYCKVCKMPNCRSNECKMISDFKEHLETI